MPKSSACSGALMLKRMFQCQRNVRYIEYSKQAIDLNAFGFSSSIQDANNLYIKQLKAKVIKPGRRGKTVVQKETTNEQ